MPDEQAPAPEAPAETPAEATPETPEAPAEPIPAPVEPPAAPAPDAWWARTTVAPPVDIPAPAPTPTDVGAEVAAVVTEAETTASNVLDHASDFATTVEGEIENAKTGLAHLETSSNATAIGTIVATSIAHFKTVIGNLEAALGLFKTNTGK